MSCSVFAIGVTMLKISLLVACAIALTGCGGTARTAKIGYIKAANAYNACLLGNPAAPANCTAQKTVMDNDLQVYNTVSSDE
jgi:hypothetical protein